MTTKLAECAWEQGQIVKSAMSYDRGEKFLPSVVGNNYDWLRFKCYMGNVGEYKINLVRALSDDVGEIFAEGNLVHLGRRIATADGRVVDAAGKLYAHGTVTCIILS